MKVKDAKDKIREKPLIVTAVAVILLFWILTPLIAQKYLNYSAINTSFAITVFYFAAWKLHNYFN